VLTAAASDWGGAADCPDPDFGCADVPVDVAAGAVDVAAGAVALAAGAVALAAGTVGVAAGAADAAAAAVALAVVETARAVAGAALALLATKGAAVEMLLICMIANLCCSRSDLLQLGIGEIFAIFRGAAVAPWDNRGPFDPNGNLHVAHSQMPILGRCSQCGRGVRAAFPLSRHRACRPGRRCLYVGTAGAVAADAVMALTAQAILERTQLFRGLPPATIQQISALSTRRAYRRGAIVFSQIESGDALYGVAKGKIRISASSPDGREMFLNIMEPGDTFGEIALLDGRQRTATATAIAPSELIIIARNDFLELLPREPKLISHLMELLCQRIRWTSGLAEESVLLSLPARLARRLLSLGELHGRVTPAGVELIISQEELARFLGLSRQIVNQHLQSWKASRWVTLGRNKICIIDERALRNVIAGNPPLEDGLAR
jgi:CRP-like cAMP-binding protein